MNRLDGGIGHTKESIISKHYGFTDGLLEDSAPLCILCLKAVNEKEDLRYCEGCLEDMERPELDQFSMVEQDYQDQIGGPL